MKSIIKVLTNSKIQIITNNGLRINCELLDMFLKKILLSVVLAWVLLGSNNALAKAHDHGQHHNHKDTIVSPFDVEKEVPSLHCIIRDHTHQGFCPHEKSERNQTTQIATDCGGQTTPSIPNTASFSNDFSETSFLVLSHYSPDTIMASSKIPSYHSFIDSLDPPPRVL
jgi:hypothetical protein